MEFLQELRVHLQYNPDSGEFIWIIPNTPAVKPGSFAGCYSKGHNRFVIRFKNKLYLRSRLAWLYFYGVWPSGLVDHINQNPKDDSIANLRDVNRSTNNHNSVVAKGHSSTGLRGVRKNHRGFQAVISINKKIYYLGTYKTPEEAHQAYIKFKSENLNNI